MLNHPLSNNETETPRSSIRLTLLIGTATFCILLLLLSVVGWVLTGWSPEFSPKHVLNPWWLESMKLIHMVFTLVFAMVLVGVINAGCFLITLALGDRVIAAWRRLHCH